MNSACGCIWAGVIGSAQASMPSSCCSAFSECWPFCRAGNGSAYIIISSAGCCLHQSRSFICCSSNRLARERQTHAALDGARTNGTAVKGDQRRAESEGRKRVRSENQEANDEARMVRAGLALNDEG